MSWIWGMKDREEVRMSFRYLVWGIVWLMELFIDVGKIERGEYWEGIEKLV